MMRSELLDIFTSLLKEIGSSQYGDQLYISEEYKLQPVSEPLGRDEYVETPVTSVEQLLDYFLIHNGRFFLLKGEQGISVLNLKRRGIPIKPGEFRLSHFVDSRVQKSKFGTPIKVFIRKDETDIYGVKALKAYYPTLTVEQLTQLYKRFGYAEPTAYDIRIINEGKKRGRPKKKAQPEAERLKSQYGIAYISGVFYKDGVDITEDELIDLLGDHHEDNSEKMIEQLKQ